jgi:hypothetical protein
MTVICGIKNCDSEMRRPQAVKSVRWTDLSVERAELERGAKVYM